MRVAITGANGFLGSALVKTMAQSKRFEVVAMVRSRPTTLLSAVRYEVMGDYLPDADWGAVLSGVEVVIHTAARVHVMRDRARDPLTEFRRINVQGTLNLARQAAQAGVRRFVFVSSIKVNGESTELGHPFTAEDPPAPQDAYGISKYEAEEGLRLIAKETGMELVIVRPPLVYGPGVKANFAEMIRLVRLGFPLPFGAIDNRRSFVALDNLVDLLVRCVDHPEAPGHVFLVSDGEDVSTVELLRRVASVFGAQARLLPVPLGMLKILFLLLNRSSAFNRLALNLQIDLRKTQEVLEWRPKIHMVEALSNLRLRVCGEKYVS